MYQLRPIPRAMEQSTPFGKPGFKARSEQRAEAYIAIRAVAEFNGAQGLRYSKPALFKHFGVPERTGFKLLGSVSASPLQDKRLRGKGSHDEASKDFEEGFSSQQIASRRLSGRRKKPRKFSDAILEDEMDEILDGMEMNEYDRVDLDGMDEDDKHALDMDWSDSGEVFPSVTSLCASRGYSTTPSKTKVHRLAIPERPITERKITRIHQTMPVPDFSS
jgi:hypothetical protein